MRQRLIKPEFWSNEELASVSESARLLAIGLLNYSDDEGYFNANAGLVKAALFPLTEPSRSIHDSLTELSDIGFIELLTGTDGKSYGRVINFGKHQTINRATKSVIAPRVEPKKTVQKAVSVTTHGGLSEDSVRTHAEEKRREDKLITPHIPPRGKFDPLEVELPVSLQTSEGREAWKSWIRHLRQKHKPPTEEAVRRQLRRLSEVPDPVVWIDCSIERNYQSIYPPAKNGKPEPPKPTLQPARLPA